jgi:hypothetical protein
MPSGSPTFIANDVENDIESGFRAFVVKTHCMIGDIHAIHKAVIEFMLGLGISALTDPNNKHLNYERW